MAGSLRGFLFGRIHVLRRAILCAGIGIALWVSGWGYGEANAVITIGRMGAGPPAGWRLNGENHAWEAEPSRGPLGPGAARISFSGAGKVELISPPQSLRAGAKYAIHLWCRSEPAGASLEIALCDNDGDQEGGFKISTTATDAWQPVMLQEALFPAAKGRYYLKVQVNGANSQVWLDGLWFGEMEEAPGPAWRPEISPAGIQLTPESSWGLVTGTEPMRVQARVVGVTEPGCRIQGRVVHVNGGEAPLPAQDLDTQGVWNGAVEIDSGFGALNGMLRVEAAVIGPDGKPRSPRAETLLARVYEPVPGPLPKSAFGVHVLLKDPDLSVVAKLGYKWCRIHDASCITKWGCAEPEKGQWVWRDDQVDLARGYGLSILGMLDGAPPWASGSTEGGYFGVYHAPKDLGDWRNYVGAMVGHYAGQIDEWEVWNEPWDIFRFFQGGNPALYAVLLEAAYKEAKKVNPNCTIVGVDTYPPFWDAAVLALGAYPNYDVLSWHRYDSNLAGRPNDAIARVAARLEAVQKPYGEPKPLMCSEGGPDVTLFHGSFFSFAEPKVTGDWSRGADAYARWFLSAVAAGNQRFIAYSIHGFPRHGFSTHMMVEPGPLLRPMHVSVSALAHFIEGTRLETRLCPAQDISAFLFREQQARVCKQSSGIVAVLMADGDEPEDLPRPLPADLSYFDRWGNPTPAPAQATRSLLYIVAEPSQQEALLQALQPAPESDGMTVEGLLDAAVASMRGTGGALASLFSAQGSLAVLGNEEGVVAAHKADLKQNAAVAGAFTLPGTAVIVERMLRPAGPFTMGQARIAAAAGGAPQWTALFVASPDGPQGGFRLVQWTVIPDNPAPDPETVKPVEALLRAWERSLKESDMRPLWRQFSDGPCCVAAATMNGEYFVFSDPDYLLTMMNTVVVWGKANRSAMTFDTFLVNGGVAAVMGRWEIDSLAFGAAPYAFTATLRKNAQGEWKIISLCNSAGRK